MFRGVGLRNLGGSIAVLVLGACGPAAVPGPPQPASESTSSVGAVVSGHVSWPDCSQDCPSASGIPVYFSDLTVNQVFTATSDATGRYSIELPPGTYKVIAGHADRSLYEKRITVRPHDALTMDLFISPPTG